jgi:hypothetical protein
MITGTLQRLVAAAALFALSTAGTQAMGSYQDEFGLANCNLQTSGRNEYFILEPGYQLVLEAGGHRVEITVLDETKTVAGVNTRVVEEREWNDGHLKEVARNYFAICDQTKDVFYFGEDVDNYKDGKVANHDGTWLAGVNNNKPGLMMPGTPKPKMKYYQEIAPGVAMDRAEVMSLNETCTTPAGTFKRCMKVKEGSALELLAKEYKYHAPGIGLVREDELVHVRYGFIKPK